MRFLLLPLFLAALPYNSAIYRDYGLGYDDIQQYGSCYRPCDGGPPRICYYKIVEEMYPSLSGACGDCASGKEDDCMLPHCVSTDGVERTVFSMNRKVPGPGIHVCAGDTVSVDLVVKLPGHQETLHWHGILQKGTQYMDGVPMITQCPIEFGQTFRYLFHVPAPNTFFYHSHSGVNKANGVAGSLVARQPKWKDPHGVLYDVDRAQDTIVLQDWFSDADAEFVFPGLTTRTVGQPATSILINGRGRTVINGTRGEKGAQETKTVLSEFWVKRGLRYRFRVINAGSMSCPMEIIFEKHKLLLIETDGENLKPVEVNRVVLFSGERYSFIVTTNQAVRSYWIHVRTAGFCVDTGNVVDQVAILRYEGSDDPPPTPRPTPRQNWPGPVVNDPKIKCGTPGSVCVTELRALAPPPHWPNPHISSVMNEPDLTIVLPVGFHLYNYANLYKPTTYNEFLAVGRLNLAGHVNNITFLEPSSPLLTEPGKAIVCDGNHKPEECKGKETCECTHLVKLKLKKFVDFLIVDATSTNGRGGPYLAHPMHIHGHTFTVLNWGGMEEIADGQERIRILTERARKGQLPKPTSLPPMKDTVSLPGTGYVRFRIYTDNPGVWFFHCHFTYHMASGMEMAIQTGDAKDFPPLPEGFPTCGSYKVKAG